MANEKRYVVQVEMYVYADNDYMARKRADSIRKVIDQKDYADYVKVTEIGEQAFATPNYRKLEDPSFTPKDRSNEPLPF
jgi:hypothetical protein